MHLNGFVDVVSKAFLDVIIQPGQEPDEREALHTMLDHFKSLSSHPIYFQRNYSKFSIDACTLKPAFRQVHGELPCHWHRHFLPGKAILFLQFREKMDELSQVYEIACHRMFA